MDADAKVLKAKLSLNWTGPHEVLAVGPVPSLTPLTATLSALSPYPCIFPPTYPVRMFAGALR